MKLIKLEKNYKKFLNKKKKEKYIVFVDSCLDHKDVVKYQGNLKEDKREKYYFLIKNILNTFKKFYKKKIIICLHPKTNKKVIEKYLKGFYITKFNTLFYITRAKIILFHESSAIINAIILKKKIINLYGSIMGPYYKIRNKIYPKLINIPRLNINDCKKIKKKQLNKFERFNDRYNGYINFIKTKDLKNFSKRLILIKKTLN
jgi:hypothetical protein